MKKLIPLLLAVLLMAGCTRTYDGPTETVWVITESVTEQYSTVTDYVQTDRTVFAYDIYGNPVQTLQYKNDKEISRTVRTYDDQGNLLTETIYDLDGLFPKRSARRECTYDDQGRILSDILDQGSTKYYTYDDAAHQYTTTVDGVVAKIEQFAEDGTLLWEKEYDWNGWIQTEYTYDTDGEILERHITDSSGNDYIERYERNSNGDYIRSWRIEDGVETEVYHQEYEYDDQGRMVRLYKIEDGVRRESSRREYLDENGSYTSYRDGQPSFTTIFDERGNWIENAHYFAGTQEVGYRQRTIYEAIQVPIKEGSP